VMGGDCAHSRSDRQSQVNRRQLMLGEKDIGTWKDAGGNEMCMHGDPVAAKATMRKLKQLGEMKGVHIALAHVEISNLNDEILNGIMIS